MHARLGAAGERGVGVAALDQLGRFADGVRAGRARRDGRVVRAAKAERDRELPARRVDEHARDERRRDAVEAALAQHLGLLHDAEEAADRAAEEDADPRRVVDALEAGVGDRLPGGAEREQDVPVELARLLVGRDRGRVEVLDLGGDPHGKRARVEGADEVDAAPARDGGLPGRPRVAPDRRHRAEPRDHDPPHSANVDGARRVTVAEPVLERFLSKPTLDRSVSWVRNVQGCPRHEQGGSDMSSRGPTPQPGLVFFYSPVSGSCRRVEGFLAQVLQRRRNHGTFKLYRVDEQERPDLVERFAVETMPTLVVVEDKIVRARLERPRGCREIESFLAPWLK